MPADPASLSDPAGQAGPAGPAPLVRLRRVAKRYGSVTALDSIDLDIHAAGIHAVIGENGAGKSTLGRILAGAARPDRGEIMIRGRPIRLASPRAALRAGVAAISQELTLVPTLSVIDNIFLGNEEGRGGLLSGGRARRRYAELDTRVGFGLDPDRLVRYLGVADRQKVEIARAIARNAQVLVMDEPTAALVTAEAGQLMRITRELAAAGTAIIYIAHALDEVLALAGTITVMRDGRIVQTGPASSETPATLATAMIGRPVELEFPARAFPGAGAEVVCQVEGLAREPRFRDVSFGVRAGEILGLAGLAGSGCSDVARVLGGADRATRGRITLGGYPARLHTPRDARAHGISLLPENRREQGLFLERPVRENVSAGCDDMIANYGWVSRRRERTDVTSFLSRFDVRMSSPDDKARTLSGGNQQKVLLAKCAFPKPRLLVAVQPTRGVDVGARASIYRLLAGLAAEGLAIVLVSPETEEIYGLSHRIMVLRRGRVTAELQPAQVSYGELMRHIVGAVPGSATEGP